MVRAVCVWAMDCHGKGNGLPRSSRLQGRRKVARIGGARTAAVHHSLLVTCRVTATGCRGNGNGLGLFSG